MATTLQAKAAPMQGKGGAAANAVPPPPRSDTGDGRGLHDLAAALRGKAAPPEPPLPSKQQWKSGLARMPEERLRKILVEHQHPEASKTHNEPYIALTEFAKAVGAVVLPTEGDGKRRKVTAKAAPNAGGDKGGGKGAGDAMEVAYKTSAEDRLSSAARTWVSNQWADQKRAATRAATAGENPRVKAEELNEHRAGCAHPSFAFMRLCKYLCFSSRKSGRDVPR